MIKKRGRFKKTRVAGVLELVDSDEKKLDLLYIDNTFPKEENMPEGRFTGSLLHGNFFPLNIIQLRNFFQNPVIPWNGVRMQQVGRGESQGINMFNIGPIESRAFRFTAFRETALFGSKEALVFHYDRRENPAWLRPLRSELKLISAGLYLGRSYYFTQGHNYFLFYFYLQG